MRRPSASNRLLVFMIALNVMLLILLSSQFAECGKRKNGHGGYYAVARGKEIGVYRSWAECKERVHGYKNARFKKFLTEHDAMEFISSFGESSSINQQMDQQQSSEYKTSNGIPIVYTDGSCHRNGLAGAKAGIGVFWGYEHPDNVSAPVEYGNANTNCHRAGYLAAITAMEKALEKGYSLLVIRTDSNLLIKSMTQWLDTWKENGWNTKEGKPVKNRDLLERMDHLMRQIQIQFEKVNAHSHDNGNDWAHKLAKEGAAKHNEE